MRIIGGSVAGRIIQVPKGLGVRPTPDLVRQAIFNSLGPMVQGARVLDLFSGSGAIGLECLSREADFVLSVEKSAKHARWIRENRRECGLPPSNHSLRVQDAFKAIEFCHQEGRGFDLIMADPPFGDKNNHDRSRSLSQKLLDDERLPNLLEKKGLFFLGHAKRDRVTLTSQWEHLKTLSHGDSIFEVLRTARHASDQDRVAENPDSIESA